MRIDRVDLIRYGHFFQRAIEIPQRQPDFFVVYGDNEAGKSTLLRGISALLFGVPPRTPDVHSCKGPELRIGATISNSTASFSFRRRKGTTATLLSESETQIPEDRLSPFLRGIDRASFEQFFGLDHIRLRQGGEELLRGEGEIGSALFQAAGFDLRKLLDALDKETGELFSPRSKSRVIGGALEEYKQARAQMRNLSLSGAAVKEKQAELDRAKVGPLVFRGFDSKSKIRNIRAPMLFFHGDRDEIIPLNLGRSLFEAAPEPKWFIEIPGARHNDLVETAGPAYREKLHEFYGHLE